MSAGILLLGFCSLALASAVVEDVVNCTEGLKARATIKFSECQELLLPKKWCNEFYRETLKYWPRQRYDEDYPNKTHEDESCTARAKISSCEHVRFLTEVCGAHYDTCHSAREKREILRMWIKQFVRATHEVYWEFYFADDNQEIKEGKCNNILRRFFEEEELPELLSLIDSGPNTFREEESEVWENVTYLVPTKVSNLTQDFGTMLDTAGERLPSKIAFGEKSHWAYCDWKMAHIISDYQHLSDTIPELMRCDGKCNNEDGTLDYARHHDLQWGNGGIFECIENTKNDIVSDAGGNIDDLDVAKMGLCRGFKTLLENCSNPIGECIGNIAVKEILMAEYLKVMVPKLDYVIEFVEKSIPHFFGGFTYDDCSVFGGEIAGSSFLSASLLQIVVIAMACYYTFLQHL